MEDYFEELREGGELDETGLTNEVVFTEKGTVVKTYSKYPFTSFLESITELLNGRLNYVSRDERMRNEIEVKEIIREIGYGTAEVIEVGGKSIEFERVPGVSGFLYLRDSSDQKARKLGEQVGDFLYKLHERVWLSRILGFQIFMWKIVVKS